MIFAQREDWCDIRVSTLTLTLRHLCRGTEVRPSFLFPPGLAFVYLFILHSSPLLQCTFHAWLTSGNAASSVRKFEQTMDALEKAMGSESSGGATPGVKVSDTTFAGVPVRVFEPPAGGEGHLRRGLMYIHGGGWTRGSASEYRQTFNRNNLVLF